MRSINTANSVFTWGGAAWIDQWVNLKGVNCLKVFSFHEELSLLWKLVTQASIREAGPYLFCRVLGLTADPCTQIQTKTPSQPQTFLLIPTALASITRQNPTHRFRFECPKVKEDLLIENQTPLRTIQFLDHSILSDDRTTIMKVVEHIRKSHRL